MVAECDGVCFAVVEGRHEAVVGATPAAWRQWTKTMRVGMMKIVCLQGRVVDGRDRVGCLGWMRKIAREDGDGVAGLLELQGRAQANDTGANYYRVPMAFSIGLHRVIWCSEC